MVNRVLIVTVVVVAVVGIAGLFTRGGSFNLEPAAASVEAADAVGLEMTSDLSRELAAINHKTLFKGGGAPERDTGSAQINRQTIQDLAASLTLVGIVAGDQPVALIRDDVAKKTYTLRTNEYVDVMLLKEITHNSVVLEYQGESLELKL